MKLAFSYCVIQIAPDLKLGLLFLVSFYDVTAQSSKTNVIIQFQHSINIKLNISFYLHSCIICILS